jgi:hypothetical protein
MRHLSPCRVSYLFDISGGDLASWHVEQKMKNENHNPATEIDEASNDFSKNGKPNQSRRRFTLTGLAAPAVVLSLTSKPVMGGNYWCTVSGGMSGGSGHGEKPNCIACSPGYWRQNPEYWPAPYYPYDLCTASCAITPERLHAATTFAEVFGRNPSGGDSNTTMMAAMGDSGSLEFHAVAALLNAREAYNKNLPSAFTTTEVISLYNNPATTSATFSGTWEGSLHNCPLSGRPTSTPSGSIFLATGQYFCKQIDSDGNEKPCGTKK